MMNFRCSVCENELTHEEYAFNIQITSYKQGKSNKVENYEVQEDAEKISEVGNNILLNNLKRCNDPNDETIADDPIL